MIINISIPNSDFTDTITIEKYVTKSTVKNVLRSDFDQITKECSQGEYIYHITDSGVTLPELYYFVNTKEGSYNLVNTNVLYSDLEEV